jgi:N-glycosylase/DNA lyase
LQICDKKEILSKESKFLEKFNSSKRKFEILLGRSEIIRNELAHSQNSIIDNLSWEKFVKTITDIELFLIKSERFIDEETEQKTSVFKS